VIRIDVTSGDSGFHIGPRWLVPMAALALLALVAIAVRAHYRLGPSGLPGPGTVVLGSIVQAILLVGVALLELAVLLGLVFFPWRRLKEAGTRGQPLPRWSRRFLLRMAAIPVALLLVQLLVLLVAFHKGLQKRTSHVVPAASLPHVKLPATPVVGAVSLSEATALALAIGVAALLAVLVLATLAHRRLARPDPEAPQLGRELTAGLDQSLAELAAGADPRQAVIAAYERMEGALARAGLARHRFETPLEYLERALARLQASRQALVRLTHLFETARFSLHPVDQGMRAEAEGALAGLRRELGD
jgi:hypothetical protein